MPGPLQRIPRSFWILLVLLAAVVVFLFWTQQRSRPEGKHIRGGPLLPFAAEQIEGLIVTRSDGQFRVEKSAAGVWSAAGAVSDYLAQNAVNRLVDALATARGGPVIPGSVVEDRRYDFNAEGALRLTVLATGDRRLQLALGAVNPVTGQYYASGAERNSAFTVTADLRNQLTAVPVSLQLEILLPLADRNQVTGLDVDYRSRRFTLQRQQGRWWIRQVSGADLPRDPLVESYQSRYADRRLSDEEGTWYAADFTRVDGLIYDVSAPVVRGIPPLAEAGAARVTAGLDRPPWRVALVGDGIDPDPRSGDSDRLELSLAHAIDELVPVERRGNILLAAGSVLRTLELGPAVLFNKLGLPFRLAVADSFHLDGPGGPVIWARPGVDGWRSYPPPGQNFSDSSRRVGREAADLVANLDRTGLLAVLPPSHDRRVLAADHRLRLTAWFSDPQGGDGVEKVVEFGLLVPESLPAGSELADFPEDDLPPVGIWSPDSGRLLQIPGYVVITGRNFSDNYLPERHESSEN